MRENAVATQAFSDERAQRQGKLSAVETLHFHRRMTEADAEGAKRLVSAFEALHAALSPEQQASADPIFGEFGDRRSSSGGMGKAGPTAKAPGKSAPKPQ